MSCDATQVLFILIWKEEILTYVALQQEDS